MLRTLALLVVLAAPAIAAPPAAMPVQGRLTNLAGDPVSDGSYGMTARLCDGAGAPASVVWEKEYSSVDVADGLFTLVLGEAAALPIAAFTRDGSLWFGVAGGTGGISTSDGGQYGQAIGGNGAPGRGVVTAP